MTPSERLRFLAEARRGYLRVAPPTHNGELEAMDTADLMIWVQIETAKNLADILDDPSSAWGWLPSWCWAEWNSLNPDAKPIPT